MIRRSLQLLPPALLLTIVLAGFLARANAGIDGPPFGDESGHLIGAHAIGAGDRLYRDFIDAHGPVSFIVPWLYDLAFGWSHANGVRWTMVALALAAGSAVALSPALSRPRGSLWATALFLGPVASVWTVQGLSLVSYHTIAGCVVVAGMAAFGLPAVTGCRVGRHHAAVAGGCAALACATAYSLVPSVALLAAGPFLALAGERGSLPRLALAWAAGFASVGAVLLAWLLAYGDLVGYLVFHILTLQVNYARYAPLSLDGFVYSLEPSTRPDALVHALALAATVAGALLAVCRLCERGPTVARGVGLALLVGGVVLLDVRGIVGFQDGTFVMASVALVAVPLGGLLGGVEAGTAPAFGVAMLVGGLLGLVEHTARQASTTPWGMTRAQVIAFPGYDLNVDDHTATLRTLRAALLPGERMMALVYSPTVFLNAGVLPVRGFHEYLPWEADYARHPMLGRPRDLCATLLASPPPVVWFDGWVVAGRYKPETFIPCLGGVLVGSYARDAVNGQLFIRKDRVEPARLAGFVPS